jgi:hypothetical protein
MEVGNVLFCCLIMCWRLAAAITIYSALRNEIWVDIKKVIWAEAQERPCR